MATKYVTDIKIGDVFTNFKISENTSINDLTIIYIFEENLKRLKPQKRQAIPVALTSYAGTDGDEAYIVYAESKNASLALDPNSGKIDCSSNLTHVFIKGSPQ